MYKTISIGQLKLELFTQMMNQIAFSDFCVPAGTIEFSANDGFLNNNLMLFKLTFPGYEIEARINDGMVFIRRNGLHQNSEQYKNGGNYHVAIQWDVESIGVGVVPWSGDPDAMNGHLRAVRTPPTAPPAELVRQLRIENLLVNSAYRSADAFFLSALDCLHLCELDIRRLGSERFVWGKGGGRQATTG